MPVRMEATAMALTAIRDMEDRQYLYRTAMVTMISMDMATIAMVTTTVVMDMPAIASMGTHIMTAMTPDMVEPMGMAITDMAAMDRTTTKKLDAMLGLAFDGLEAFGILDLGRGDEPGCRSSSAVSISSACIAVET